MTPGKKETEAANASKGSESSKIGGGGRTKVGRGAACFVDVSIISKGGGCSGLGKGHLIVFESHEEQDHKISNWGKGGR